MLVLFANVSFAAFGEVTPDYLRSNFKNAVTDKNLCLKMMNMLEKETENSLYRAYLGALQTVWANHVINPFSKLSTFNKGKKNIEIAIKNNPADVEIRILRLSVQKNAPRFLGYYKNIDDDKKIIMLNFNSIKNENLSKIAKDLISI